MNQDPALPSPPHPRRPGPAGVAGAVIQAVRERVGRLRSALQGGTEADGRIVLSVASMTSFALPVLLSPIWSRAYPIEYFAVSALVQVLPGMLIGWSTLAYHNAIYTPVEERKALLLVYLSVLIAFVFTSVVGVACWFGSGWVARRVLGDATAAPWLWLVPIIMIGSLVSLVLDQWMTRKGQYRSIGRNIVLQSILAPVVPALGLLSPKTTNFIVLAPAFSLTVSCALRIASSGIWNEWKACRPRFSELIGVAREYLNFPRDVLAGNILTGFSSQLPQLMISSHFNTAVIGHYSRVGALLVIPSTVLVKPAQTVFAREGGEAYRERGDCRRQLRRTLAKLAWSLTPVYLALGLISPWLYPAFYGPAWAETGTYAQPMALYYWAAGMGVCVGDVFNIARQTKWDLAWQAMRIGIIASSLWFGARTGDPVRTLLYLAVGNVLAYALYALMARRFALRR